MTPTRKRKSGRGGKIHEAQRHTERIALRLAPDVAARLRELAAERGETMAGVVAGLVLAV